MHNAHVDATNSEPDDGRNARRFGECTVLKLLQLARRPAPARRTVTSFVRGAGSAPLCEMFKVESVVAEDAVADSNTLALENMCRGADGRG